ncbi:histidinol dehydrogenase [Neptunicella marina]|uniref:Histidinol dehydrogenase n=1 Tax=Neptunicella marina TaxID=2125989 RepID=A0A8J6IP84_9ALTE|nr:histidinol dehydrogenase [Neptunicella marina]MBC3764686.1 histidinol dehydrogenase [Neptunicella marina]
MQIWSQLSSDEQQTLLARPALKDNRQLSQTVTEIISKVRNDGDSALLEFSARFDGVTLDSLALAQSELDNAEQQLTGEVKAAIELAYANIRRFHEAQKPSDTRIETASGVVCELKHAPIAAVGLYIPGGTAPLPSTVLMLGVSAQVAGCQRKVLCTPCGKNGQIAAEIRYAAKLCGINEIYLVGGAQAIAAMAFGTQSIARVDKIFGPGNSYVTEAKQQVSQSAQGAAIDMPAGPSEVLVIADGNANAEFVASDLLSQAEHGSDSQAILVCNSAANIELVKQAVERQLAKLNRRDIAAQAMANSRYILTDSLEQSVAVSNRYAPEHLIIQTENARATLDNVTNAGSVFVGPWSPESAGDYASGTNHVLPTYGYARNYSSLGVMDFVRRYTVQELSVTGIQTIGPAIVSLANAEGLDAHANAVSIRLESLK